MNNDDDNVPPVGTPEYLEWVKAKLAKNLEGEFSGDIKPVDFDERGAIFGDIESLGKSDAELFPDELEEYTPEERRKLFKLVKKKDRSK